MALIQCRNCGCAVSDKATKCPNCGYPVATGGQGVCKECGMYIPYNTSICPYCGCPADYSAVHFQNNNKSNPSYHKKGNRSKLWTYPLISFLVAVIVSLGILWYNNSFQDKEIRQFARRFIKAVKTNDTSTIYRLYPDAKSAGSLALSDNLEDVNIKKKGKNWRVSFSSGKDIIIATDGSNKSFYIKESHGLFSYDPSIFNMAIKTGWYDPQLNDKQNAARLSDTNFTNWLNKKSRQYLNNIIKITMATSTLGPDLYPWPEETGCSYGETICTVVAANNSNHDIGGHEYTIIAQESWTYGEDNENYENYTGFKVKKKGSPKTLTGKPIPANGTVTYTWKGNGWNNIEYDFKLSAYVSFSLQAEKSAQNHMNYTGNEYSQYLAEKGK